VLNELGILLEVRYDIADSFTILFAPYESELLLGVPSQSGCSVLATTVLVVDENEPWVALRNDGSGSGTRVLVRDENELLLEVGNDP